MQQPLRSSKKCPQSYCGRWRVLWLLSGIFFILFPCGGATCAKRRTLPDHVPPIVFEQTATLEQLMEKFNNTRNIERLNSNTVSISSSMSSVTLDGNLSWHRPYDFRLTASPGGMRMLGDAIDAGSNAEHFWLLTKMPGGQSELLYASHQEFETQTGPRHLLPISPLWIREALGVIEFDPSWHHEGPIERTADRNVEIRSLIPTARGSYYRTAIIEPTRATIQQLILADPDHKVVAMAKQSEHEYFSSIGATLPHRIDLQLIGDNSQVMAFTIQVGFYTINSQSGDESRRYVMPEVTGYKAIDLVQANAMVGK